MKLETMSMALVVRPSWSYYYLSSNKAHNGETSSTLTALVVSVVTIVTDQGHQFQSSLAWNMYVCACSIKQLVDGTLSFYDVL